MVDIYEISAVLAAAGVLTAVVYYILDIRHQTKMRQTDLILRLFSTYSSREFVEAGNKYLSADFKDYNEFVKKYGPFPSDNPVQTAFWMVPIFFEGIGELLHRRLVDIQVVDDLFVVEVYWKKFEPLMMDLRKQFGPSWFEWFEYLHNELKKEEQKLQKP